MQCNLLIFFKKKKKIKAYYVFILIFIASEWNWPKKERPKHTNSIERKGISANTIQFL